MRDANEYYALKMNIIVILFWADFIIFILFVSFVTSNSKKNVPLLKNVVNEIQHSTYKSDSFNI